MFKSERLVAHDHINAFCRVFDDFDIFDIEAFIHIAHILFAAIDEAPVGDKFKWPLAGLTTGLDVGNDELAAGGDLFVKVMRQRLGAAM